MDKLRLCAALALPVVAVSVTACAGGGGGAAGATGAGSPASSSPASSSAGAASCSGAVGLMAPITGGAAAIGGEQLNFAKLAVSKFNKEKGTTFTLAQGDTQLDPGQASTVAQQFVSDSKVFAVVGPAGSQEVEAVGPAFAQAHLAFISPSATRTSLSEGKYPTFFRVIPTDAVQGPTDADYLSGKLGAKKVVVVEEKTSYGQGLSDAVETALKAKGVAATRIPVSQKQPDYSAVVSKVSADTGAVFATFQIAANTEVLANQLKQQGKSAVVFASDGSFSSDFNVPGAYVSSFAPDIKGIPADTALVSEYTATYHSVFGTFGPPVYAATRVALEAAARACPPGGGKLDRAAVVTQVKATRLTDSILGGSLAFKPNGDVDGARFYIFKLGADGKPALVQ